MTQPVEGVGEDLQRRAPVLAGVASVQGAKVGRRRRRWGLLVLALVVALAAARVLDARDTTTSRQISAESQVSLRYPQVTRPGLDTEVELHWRNGTPLTEDFVVLVDQSMYRDLGIEMVVPEPLSQTSAGGVVRLTFNAPQDELFTLTFMGRLPPREPLGSHRFTVALDGVAESRIDARTWVLP